MLVPDRRCGFEWSYSRRIKEDVKRSKLFAQDSYTECVSGIFGIDKSIDKCLNALKNRRIS